MEINCPSCDEAVLIADEDMGTTIECPFCQQRFALEKPEPPLIEKSPPPIVKQPWWKPPAQPSEPSFLLTPLKWWIREGRKREAKRQEELNTNALIQCPSCGKDISKRAHVCLNCGHPIGEIRPWWQRLSLMVGDSFYAVIDLQSRYPRLANVFWGLFTLALFFFLITMIARWARPG